ncbi:hypothetical protein GGD65_007840 [Bradyrhizobium sp. CIR18]|uniref:hypothetical protein n=1 Tax=Bradyrhizobium sp. CIR18 TaxID=2663839 RepID=UPI0016064B3C|nr:hypothetical protein [Bradyrhizobium sp. CIR18]MBB4366766.1 hypothetical protein [Bradyrhizobium sp. CIR18]
MAYVEPHQTEAYRVLRYRDAFYVSDAEKHQAMRWSPRFSGLATAISAVQCLAGRRPNASVGMVR